MHGPELFFERGEACFICVAVSMCFAYSTRSMPVSRRRTVTATICELPGGVPLPVYSFTSSNRLAADHQMLCVTVLIDRLTTLNCHARQS